MYSAQYVLSENDFSFLLNNFVLLKFLNVSVTYICVDSNFGLISLMEKCIVYFI